MTKATTRGRPTTARHSPASEPAKQTVGTRPFQVRAIDGGKVRMRSVERGTTGDAATERVGHLSKEEREKQLARLNAGEVFAVLVEAITYVQRVEPNRNLTRISETELKDFAASFEGRPVLRDHAHDDSLARAGKIISSKLERRPGEPGASQIRMELRLDAPWAIELALRDLTNEFSVGWHSANAACSICGESMTTVWSFMVSACSHELGETYAGKICEVEFSDTEGLEVSMVNVPGVRGTGVEGVRAQLSASTTAEGELVDATARLAAAPGSRSAPPSRPSMAQLSVELGLAATAGLDEVLGAVTTLRSELAAVRQAVVAHEAAALERDIDAEIERAFREGRLSIKRNTNGQRIESAIEKGLRRTGRNLGIEALREHLNDLPAGLTHPVLDGTPRNLSEDPTPRSEPLSEVQKHVNRLIGIDDAVVARHLRAVRTDGKEQ